MLKRVYVLTLVIHLTVALTGQSRPMFSQADSNEGASETRASVPSPRIPAVDGIDLNPSTIRVSSGVDETALPDTPRKPVPSASETPTEFQSFVADSVGTQLPLFGYNLFQDVPSTFAPADRIPLPANYIVGPGDELLIRAWGQIDVDARVVVDRNGQIFLPKVGSVSVAGVSYAQLSDYLKAAVGHVFRNFDLTVTIGQLRSIQIFVVGHARRPGAYTVSSLSTLVNALFASGGPSVHGSMRHIQLKRASQVATDFDMYDLLLKGDKSKDVPLLPGDVIYIPPVGPQAALAGSVNYPAIYELHNSCTLAEQLEMAGGLTSVADGQRVIVERIENHNSRMVEEFRLDAAGLKRELHDGDLIKVFSISPKFDNAITLRGNVALPGRYPFRAGMKIRDVIPNREFLLTREFWRGHNSDTDSRVTALPESRNRTDIKRHAPDINWDYAVVQRINPIDLSTKVLPFNLGQAILGADESDNLELQPGDVITIFSQRDIAVPSQHQSKLVRLEGEFKAPGVYRVEPGETLRSLIYRAGGLTDQAFVFGAQFTRESARAEQQASLDQMVHDLEMESQHRSLNDAAAHPDQQLTFQAQLQSERMLIQKLRNVTASGRVVLEIERTKSGAESFPEIALEDGDTLEVPNTPSTVNVVGAVYNQSSFVFKQNRKVADYLRLSGGGTRDADMKHMFIIRADGSVLSSTNASLWSGGLDVIRTVPGDTIVLPVKLERGGAMRALKDWSQIVSQFGLGAAAINVLR